MAEDWLADVRKYVADADETVVSAIVKYLGSRPETAIPRSFPFSDKKETDRVRENFLKKKLGLTDDDATLDAAIAGVGERMKEDRRRTASPSIISSHSISVCSPFGGAAGAAGAAAAAAGLAGRAVAGDDGEPSIPMAARRRGRRRSRFGYAAGGRRPGRRVGCDCRSARRHRRPRPLRHRLPRRKRHIRAVTAKRPREAWAGCPGCCCSCFSRRCCSSVCAIARNRRPMLLRRPESPAISETRRACGRYRGNGDRSRDPRRRRRRRRGTCGQADADGLFRHGQHRMCRTT